MRFAKGKKGKNIFGKVFKFTMYFLVLIAVFFAFYETQIYYYLLIIGNWKMAASNIIVSIDEYMGITAGIISAYHLIKSSKLSSSLTCR